MTEMTYRRLGRSGLAVSAVGIGCNQFGRKVRGGAEAVAIVEAALDAGITLFDTADVYGDPRGGSEELLGSALAKVGRRDEIVLATKFGADSDGLHGPDWGARAGRRYLHKAVEASLRRLRTDYIDLYQLHTPADAATPIEETLAALDDLVRAGKVRYLGNSNFAGWQVADADWTARTLGTARFVSAQNEYSLVNRAVEEELIPACERFGLGLLPYFPLASGLLTGKYQRDAPAPPGSRLATERYAGWLGRARWDTIDAVRAYADKRGLSMLEVAIGGLAARPVVASVIAGATSPEQVHTNARAIAWRPSTEDLAELDALTGA
jgi:aryl-alcohol dehydrogenase-like predicted oxidoreductase